MITNVGAKELPVEKIYPLYRSRRQVELMFKNWKSVFSLHGLQKMKENRYITMLYVRLILVVVNLQIIYGIQFCLSKTEGKKLLLSFNKALKTLKNMFPELMQILRASRKTALKRMLKFYELLSKNHARERRKNKQNFCEIIELFIWKSER
jgi:hypothetical protein